MRIGIDLDGVVFDSEKEYRVYSELYDMIELKQNSKINNKELNFQDRFDWTQEQCIEFFNKYLIQIMEKSNYMPGAIDVLKMLKEEGNELILVTARGGYEPEAIKMSQRRLKESELDIFKNYFWGAEDKAKVCKEENIDIMIDDSFRNCKSIADAGIKVLYFRSAPSYELQGENVKTVYNWGEVYRELGKKTNNN